MQTRRPRRPIPDPELPYTPPRIPASEIAAKSDGAPLSPAQILEDIAGEVRITGRYRLEYTEGEVGQYLFGFNPGGSGPVHVLIQDFTVRLEDISAVATALGMQDFLPDKTRYKFWLGELEPNQVQRVAAQYRSSASLAFPV